MAEGDKNPNKTIQLPYTCSLEKEAERKIAFYLKMEMSCSINDKQVDQNQNNITAQTRLSWKPITLQRLYEYTLFQSETRYCFHCNTDSSFRV